MRELDSTASGTRPESLLRLNAVVARTSLSRSEIYRLMSEGAFPQNFKLGERSVVWRESEVSAWIHGVVHRQQGAS
ncbi:hypothetical protein LMG27952_01742 [Paraburkholderia hiiakae]|uniref:AlpA family transcriptional regulator n=1 Tax=Paraburkholderia hiiakae TaxID=1081782 RepID=A0ABM8NGY8_9BURK|nr:AlpA family transcriptional regulator [Paraburkholderia hiiakae]CAD6524616.1 hypothetical protein LMG27952_01742 [Paraburkholderia hiiakae]